MRFFNFSVAKYYSNVFFNVFSMNSPTKGKGFFSPFDALIIPIISKANIPKYINGNKIPLKVRPSPKLIAERIAVIIEIPIIKPIEVIIKPSDCLK